MIGVNDIKVNKLTSDGKNIIKESLESTDNHTKDRMTLSKFHRKNVEIIDIDNVKFKGFVTHYSDEIENDGEISIIIETDDKDIIEFEKNEIKSITVIGESP